MSHVKHRVLCNKPLFLGTLKVTHVTLDITLGTQNGFLVGFKDYKRPSGIGGVGVVLLPGYMFISWKNSLFL